MKGKLYLITEMVHSTPQIIEIVLCPKALTNGGSDVRLSLPRVSVYLQGLKVLDWAFLGYQCICRASKFQNITPEKGKVSAK